MKFKTAFPALLVLTGITAASLFGCADGTSPQSANTQAEKLPTDKDVASSYLVQIEYYEGLIRDLEAALLKEKEDNFVEIIEYKQKLQELEDAISALKEQSPPVSPPTTIQPPTVETVSRVEGDATEDNNLNHAPSKDQSPRFSVIVSEGGVSIVGCTGEEEKIDIPSEIDGSPVISIGEGAFKNCGAAKITVPDSVVEIDWFAFADCESLYEIYLPPSVTHIGHGAFDRCSSSLVIKCEKGSYAERYAKSWGILCICK